MQLATQTRKKSTGLGIIPIRTRLPLLALAVALLLPVLGPAIASAQTLTGTNLELSQGTIRSAGRIVMTNAADTLRLEGSLREPIGAGMSTSTSGLHLTGAVWTVPEPGLGLLVASGFAGLSMMGRRRNRRSPADVREHNDNDNGDGNGPRPTRHERPDASRGDL
jgi:hypothetical protein